MKKFHISSLALVFVGGSLFASDYKVEQPFPYKRTPTSKIVADSLIYQIIEVNILIKKNIKLDQFKESPKTELAVVLGAAFVVDVACKVCLNGDEYKDALIGASKNTVAAVMVMMVKSAWKKILDLGVENPESWSLPGYVQLGVDTGCHMIASGVIDKVSIPNLHDFGLCSGMHN